MITATGSPSTNSNQAASNGAPAPFFQPLTLDQMLSLPPKTWLVDQVVGEGDLVILYGQPGGGKTFVLLDLVAAACLGREWIGNWQPDNGWKGRFRVNRPLTVAYCPTEGVGGLPDRFRATADFWGIHAGTLPNLFVLREGVQLFDGRARNSIQQLAHDWQSQPLPPLDLLIVDTLAGALAGGDENSARDVGIALDNLRYTMNRLGCAVILAHHTRKSDDTERGSSALRGAADTMLQLSVNGEHTLTPTKLKDAEPWAPANFVLKRWQDSVVPFWSDAPAPAAGRRQSITDRVLAELQAHPHDRYTIKALAALIGGKESAIGQALARLRDKGRIDAHQDCQLPGQHVVEWQLADSLRAAMQAAQP